MTDLRTDDFDWQDLPSAEDAPPAAPDGEPASHDDADNPDVAEGGRWPADGSGDEFDGGYDPTADAIAYQLAGRPGEQITDANGDELEHGEPDASNDPPTEEVVPHG